jgi:hypothetical protein
MELRMGEARNVRGIEEEKEEKLEERHTRCERKERGSACAIVLEADLVVWKKGDDLHEAQC